MRDTKRCQKEMTCALATPVNGGGSENERELMGPQRRRRWKAGGFRWAAVMGTRHTLRAGSVKVLL